MKSRNVSSTLLTAFCVILAFGSCAAAPAQKLTVWVGDGQPRLDEYKFVCNLFEKENPHITVEVQGQAGGQGQVMEKLALSIAAGAPPDASWLEGSAVLEFAAQGLLLEVTRAVDGIRFAPADTEEMTFNGRMWAVPYHTAARGLFKRIDLFEQAGLNPYVDPKTMEELYAWNQKLTRRNPDGTFAQAGLVPWVGNWGAPAWIWTFGGQLIEKQGTKVIPTATYSKNVDAFAWLANWGQFFGTRTPVTAGWGGFRDGTVAMSPESTSVVGRLIAADVPFTTGRVPNPPGGQNGTWGGGTAIGVPVNVSNPELSLKLVRFFGEAKVQIERFGFAPDVLPANWQGLLTVGRQLPREWQGLLDQFPEARARTPLWIEYYVNQLNPAMNAVVDGKKTPQQALNDVQLVMEALSGCLWAVTKGRYTIMSQSQLAINGGTPVRKQPWPPRALFGEDEKRAVDELFDQAIASGNAFGYEGPTERAYCEDFATFLGGGFVDAVNSGTTAVYVALRALNPEPYTEIIVSPITDQGGVMPVPLLNCIPVVADAAPGCFNVGPEQIEAAITPLTSAIVVAHIMGEPADMEGIMAVARRHGIPVVEDCAQAHGAKLNGKYLGTFSEVSAFSTMFGKHHATGSQGGLVFTKDEALYVKVRQASDRGKPFGMPAGSTNTMATLNFNLGDLGSAIGRVQLRKLPHIVAKRQQNAAAIIAGICDLGAVSAPEQVPGAEPSYWFLRLQVNEEHLSCTKREFCSALAAEGISNNPEYAAFPHRAQWFRERRVFGTSELPWSSPLYRGKAPREFAYPNALQAVASQFLLPVSESWGEQEVSDVVEAIHKVATAFAI